MACWTGPEHQRFARSRARRECARIRVMRNLAIAVAVMVAAGIAAAQDAAAPPHETVFYRSGTLNLEAYVYTPPGKGPFPLVVYNHGSRAGQERTEWPVAFIARWLVPEGFAVMVPERRG